MFANHNRKQRRQPPLGREQDGQGLAEFALTMPLLIGLLVGIIVLAWVGFSYLSITSAARMGTRFMISEPEDDAAITYAVTNSMMLLDWHNATITISPQPPSSRRSDTQVSIQIVYAMNTPTIRIPYVVTPGSFVLLPPITLNATSRMRLY